MSLSSAERDKLIKKIQRQVLKNQASYFSNITKLEKYLQGMYRQAGIEILQKINNLANSLDSWDINEAHKYSRLEKLLKQINEQIQELGYTEVRNMQEHLETFYIESYLREAYILGNYVNISIDMNRLSPHMVREAVNYAWSGAMFSDRIWDNKDKLVKNVKEGVTQSLILGESMRDLADRVNKGIDNSLFNALRVARTEMMRVNYTAEQKAMRDNDIDYVQYLATTSDERTCRICGRTHLKVFKIGDEPMLPRHPQCRCTYAPYLDEIEEVSEGNEAERVRGTDSYEDWREQVGLNVKNGGINTEDLSTDIKYSGEVGKQIAKDFQKEYKQKRKGTIDSLVNVYAYNNNTLNDEKVVKDKNYTMVKNQIEAYERLLNDENAIWEFGDIKNATVTIDGDWGKSKRKLQYIEVIEYEERDNGKFYMGYKTNTPKKQKEEMETAIRGFLGKNKRATGIKIQVNNGYLDKKSNKKQGRVTMGFFRPSEDMIMMRDFKGYEKVGFRNGKKEFLETMTHELGHRVHSPNPLHSKITFTEKEWSEWKDLVEPYYEQYTKNHLVNFNAEWRRFDYPIYAEKYYGDGKKEHFYNEMWAESSSVLHTDIEGKEEEIQKLKKYFPKVKEFVEKIYDR